MQSCCRSRDSTWSNTEDSLVACVIGLRRRALDVRRQRHFAVAFQQIFSSAQLQNVKIRSQTFLKRSRKFAFPEDRPVSRSNPASRLTQDLPDVVAERLGKKYFDLSSRSAASFQSRVCSRSKDTRIIED